jgi:hypothetical protein
MEKPAALIRAERRPHHQEVFMRPSTQFVLALAIALAVAWSAPEAMAQSKAKPQEQTRVQAPAPSAAPAPDARTRVTDPEALAVLKSSCDMLAGLKSYSFMAHVDRDFAYHTGDSVRLTQSMRVTAKRPDKFRVELRGDDRDAVYVYDGKSFTAFDADKGTYGVMEAKGDTDATIKHLIKTYGVNTPLTSLLFADPGADINLEKVVGRYLGIHAAGGTRCHHLAFFGQDMNWQIWIGESDGLPRKILITDKMLPGWPQYMAVISKWDTSAKLAPGEFTFTPPKGARNVPVLQAGGKTAGN